MCYSAQVAQSLSRLARQFAADIDYSSFEDLFADRLTSDGINDSVKITKALEHNFLNPQSQVERSITQSIDTYRLRQTRKLETDLFAQKKRLADAERTLKTKETKKALNDRRIATDKIAKLVTRIGDLKRNDLIDEDSRIFPFWYAPVIVQEADRRFIRPMRYHCRPAGKPALIDRKFDGLYNARRDSLQNFWTDLFGQTHALMVVTSFFENVSLHNFERRELSPDEDPKNLVLHFNPQPPREMLIACLWSHWQAPNGKDLYSFAAITDDPPAEIAAAGHDRCIIALKDEYIDAWLSPAQHSRAELLRMLCDPQRSFYEHRIAA